MKEQRIKGIKNNFILKALVIAVCLFMIVLTTKFIQKKYVLHQFSTDIMHQFPNNSILSYRTFVGFETPHNTDSTAFNIDIGLDMECNEDYDEIFFDNINNTVTVVENYISLYGNAIINDSGYVKILIRRGYDAPNFVTITFKNDSGELVPKKLHLNNVKSFDCVFCLNNIESVNEIVLDLENTSLKMDFFSRFINMDTLALQSDFDDFNSICKLKHLKTLYLPNVLDKRKYAEISTNLPNTNIIYNGS